MQGQKQMEFWFVVGSQSLYGEEALEQVKEHAQIITDKLNESKHISYKIVLKDLATTADQVTQVMKEVNYQDQVAGVITWMHTFSPAKMWINGTKLLQKPLLHLATQFNESIPWETIDMDFMNLNQSAHGDREYGYINARLKKDNKVIVGYWQNEDIQQEIGQWMQSALGFTASHAIKVARFGDNMRNVAVTEGDKIEAAIQFGWTVDYFGIGDLVEEIDLVTDEEVDKLFNEYQKLYTFDQGDYSTEDYEASIKEQAKIEIALERFLDKGDYKAFTSNFEDLHGMKQLPGLAVQRLMAKGYGFAGEGDWKTAALDRLIKVMTGNKNTGFMEDYTYELAEGQEAVLESHMLEVDPTLASNKARIVVAPLSMGDREDPARLVFDGKAGDGVVISMADFGTHYKLLINEVELFTPEQEAKSLPVARVMWKIKPDFKAGIKEWIENGGGHHTVVSLNITTTQIVDWAKMVNLDYIVIK